MSNNPAKYEVLITQYLRPGHKCTKPLNSYFCTIQIVNSLKEAQSRLNGLKSLAKLFKFRCL